MILWSRHSITGDVTEELGKAPRLKNQFSEMLNKYPDQRRFFITFDLRLGGVVYLFVCFLTLKKKDKAVCTIATTGQFLLESSSQCSDTKNLLSGWRLFRKEYLRLSFADSTTLKYYANM